MLDKPNLPDEKIIACLQYAYGLPIAELTFLPLGADKNTAVYRAVAQDGAAYFCKLRSGMFAETSVTLPKFLSTQGITEIIPPLETKTGQLRAEVGEFKVILYPFVEGKNGYEVELSERQWMDFGAALKRIHTSALSPLLHQTIPRETYTPAWREMVLRFIERVADESFADPIAQELAVFLQAKRKEIIRLVERAEHHAAALTAHAPEFVLCHADIHAGNLVLDANGALYIVDWDNPTFAPKERDLMSIGAGLFGAWRTPSEEETLFYRGYGPTQLDSNALAYYRFERIIQDLAVECELIFSDRGDGADRARELGFFKSNFIPGGTIELAYEADKSFREGVL